MSTPTFAERLLERASSFDIAVSDAQADQLERYYLLLRRWNSRMNLTALPLEIPPAVDVVDRLFLEPLIAASLLQNEPLAWVDVGSGGGSPAIPLKVVHDQLDLTMVEPKSRKAAFLREAVRQLELKTADVLTYRVEEVGAAASSIDLITVRAVRMDGRLLECLRTLLSDAGHLVAFGPETSPSGFERVTQRSLPGTASFVSVFQLTEFSSRDA